MYKVFVHFFYLFFFNFFPPPSSTFFIPSTQWDEDFHLYQVLQVLGFSYFLVLFPRSSKPKKKEKEKKALSRSYFPLLLLPSSFLLLRFHPNGWHRTWVSQRCLHQQLSTFLSLSSQSPFPLQQGNQRARPRLSLPFFSLTKDQLL